MARILVAMALALVLVLAGCKGGPVVSKAVRLDGFRPYGTAEPLLALSPEVQEQARKYGIIYKYEKGDVLRVNFEVRSDALLLRSGQTMEIELKNPIWVYGGPQGVRVSRDGKRFTSLREAFEGLLGMKLVWDGKREQNRLDVRLDLSQK